MSPAASDTGVVELLAALAYGELTGFARLAGDSELAPTSAARAELGRLAAREFRHYEALEERLRALGADPQAAMAPFVGAIDAFHRRTAPGSWAERLVNAYVGDGLAMDLYREASDFVGEAERPLMQRVLQSEGKAEFVEQELRKVVDADPAVAGRLSLWGRRLMGEAMSQAQQLVAAHPELVAMLVPDGDLAELSRMFTRLAEAHTERMGRLGLSS
ncbi:ferritin-like fold-containing protein [Arsenicicoccus bolidensis]|uniref:Ferritin-like domain-containing protein n=1 Tax=Arsenicicoccus bolidensis TaxID=229480 RepID=A0ABS9Q0S9_9MICO|nr:ferritin-like fold-containing protein [Arsenicicoccus bolidensis]MCG7321464.1 ferritin-like domain-containing protein [Arsenicicoccus bolidensis]